MTTQYSHPKLTPVVYSRFLDMAQTDLHAARRYLGEALQVGKTQRNEWTIRLLKEAGLKQKKLEDEQSEKTTVEQVGDEFSAEVEVSRAKTLQEVIELCKVDQDRWEPKGFSVTRKKNGFGWSARFVKRGGSVASNDFVKDLKRELLQYSPTVEKIQYKTDNAKSLLEICIFDAHLGKFCWALESGDNYDLKLGKRAYVDALYDLVAKALKAGPIKRIVFPVGNDYLTCDNQNLTTTALTPQSVDSRFPKIFREARELLVESINYLKQIAPVDVIVVAGNHDQNSMLHMGDALECWFHNDKNVTIDNRPVPRKYYRYGQNLICYAHGDKINHKKLPMLAAVECDDWSQCKYREWHIGHLHHEKVVEENGVKTRIIPSITGTDEYHSSHGYIGTVRTSQAFLFDEDHGLNAIIYSKPVDSTE